MTPILSICIPTLNRAGFLAQALRSIFSAGWDTSLVELCVSNNASDRDYDAVVQLFSMAPAGLTVRYVIQERRLPVDEHMMALKNLATSRHIYFLGDDDFFLDGQLPALLALTATTSPDLAIFNGIMVDERNHVLGPHFNLPSQSYARIEDAFRDLRDKGMFGAVLVKKDHLDDAYFRSLFGTAHAYGCYWFSLMEQHQRGQLPVIVVPDFPLVALRMAAKTYNHVDVYYRDIPYEIAVYQRHLPPGLPQQLNDGFRARYLRKVSSILFLTQLRQAGADIQRIKDIDPAFHRQHRFAIALSNLLARSGAYSLVRNLYRAMRRRGAS